MSSNLSGKIKPVCRLLKKSLPPIMAILLLLLGQTNAFADDYSAQQSLLQENIGYFDSCGSTSSSDDTTTPSTTPATDDGTDDAGSTTDCACTPTTTDNSTDDAEQSADSSLTAAQKIASTFMVGFDLNTTSTSTIESVVQKYKIGGIYILGTTDAASAGITRSFVNTLDTDAGHNLVVASDEEGIFKRFTYPFDFPSAGDMGKMSDSSVETIGQKVAKTLAGDGVNTDLAPVLDVAQNSSDTDAGTAGRAFSDDPVIVADKASAFAKGLQEGGVNPVFKHFPGLGSSNGDTDNESVTSPPLSSLEQSDLLPYQNMANKYGAAVMMDNAHVPGLTETGKVASTSPAAVNLLRNKYNFSGLIVTDDLTAAGVGEPLPEAVSDALQAGVDMPLFTYTDDPTMDSVISAVQNSNVGVDDPLEKISSFVNQTQTNGDTSDTSSVSCCDTDADVGSLTGSDNVQEAYNFYVQEGLTPAQSAGVIANLYNESSIVPTADEEKGTATSPTPGDGFGIVQWTFSSRQSNLTAYANSNHEAVDSLLLQLQFSWHELKTDYASALAGLKQITGSDASAASQAAVYFRIHYEACDPTKKSCSDRGTVAEQMFDKYAQGSSVTTTPVATTDGSSSDSGSCSGSTTTSSAQSGTVAAALAAAKQLSAYDIPYSQACRTLTKTPPTCGYDCSASVSWVLLMGGFTLPSNVTWGGWAPVSGDYTNWGDPGPGQEMTVWVNGGDHVFIEFNIPGVGRYQLNTSVPGHNGPDFAPWGPEGSIDAANPDFHARHWPGT
jgi:beta-N-acetylhexosaminidase